MEKKVFFALNYYNKQKSKNNFVVFHFYSCSIALEKLQFFGIYQVYEVNILAFINLYISFILDVIWNVPNAL